MYIRKGGENMNKQLTNQFYDIREIRAINGKKLKPIHKCVLFVLESRGNSIFPTKGTIAKDCGCSKATVDKAIKELISMDILKSFRRFNSSNRYFINGNLISLLANKERNEAMEIKFAQQEFDDDDFDPWDEGDYPDPEWDEPECESNSDFNLWKQGNDENTLWGNVA